MLRRFRLSKQAFNNSWTNAALGKYARELFEPLSWAHIRHTRYTFFESTDVEIQARPVVCGFEIFFNNVNLVCYISVSFFLSLFPLASNASQRAPQNTSLPCLFSFLHTLTHILRHFFHKTVASTAQEHHSSADALKLMLLSITDEMHLKPQRRLRLRSRHACGG